MTPKQPEKVPQTSAWRIRQAEMSKKRANRKFWDELNHYMDGKGKRATGEAVLMAAENLWRANAEMRKVQVAEVGERVIVKPAQPRRIRSVVNGGLPTMGKRK